MDLSLFFAGTAGSVPTARRGLPAILLRAGGERILFDCGEGTQQQLLRSVGLPELDAIFITHFHLDHWLGLVGMLKTFDLRARERPLAIHGPPGLKALFATLRPIFGRTGYPLAIVELEPYEEVRFDGYSIGAVPGPAPRRGLRLRLRGGRPARGASTPTRRARSASTEGPDFGRLQRGETVGGVRPEQVVGGDRPGRRIVYSGDTAPCQAVEVLADGADVLVHEATFLSDERARARETGHSTAAQAAEIARDAGVRLLALTHLSTRYFPREIRDEARAVFADTVVPRDFDAIEVPFPERGEPALVKGERSRRRRERAHRVGSGVGGGANFGHVQGGVLADEGFIHFSRWAQLAGTAARYYAGVPDLVVLVVDPGALDVPQLETARPSRTSTASCRSRRSPRCSRCPTRWREQQAEPLGDRRAPPSCAR